MQYGHFDNENREYVIDRIDVPVSWTNYIGTGDMMGMDRVIISISGTTRTGTTGLSPGSRWASRRNTTPAGMVWAM